MEKRHGMMFLVLSICGTVSTLASIGVMAYLFQKNFELLSSKGSDAVLPFVGFVALPMFFTFVFGLGLVIAGVRIGLESGAVALDVRAGLLVFLVAVAFIPLFTLLGLVRAAAVRVQNG